MADRILVAQELSRLLSALSHPHRIQIIEELGNSEKDVNSLKEQIGVSQARISQHLSVMRLNRIVEERKEGRKVYYHLAQPEIAEWILHGLKFIKATIHKRDDLLEKIEKVEEMWDGHNK